MIDKEIKRNLLSFVPLLRVRGLTDEQKNRLVQIHKSYVKLLRFYAIKPNAIIEDCKRIEEASRGYLRSIRLPEQLSEEEQRKFQIVKARVQAIVEIYSDLAKECRATYQGLGKRGRPAHWQKEIYIRQMAAWYEDVTGKKPRSGTDSIFPRFLRACFYEIAPNDELSDSLLKRVVKRYHSPESIEIRRAMEEEKRRALIALRKKK